MCIILTDKANPSSTRLINIPVRLDGENRTLLIYTNDLIMKETNKESGDELMIVAIPNESYLDNFGLVDVSTENMKTFRKILFSECDKLVAKKKAKARSMYISLNDSYNQSFLSVQDVGNYSITVAPTLDDLLDRTDWEKFNVSSNYKNRLDGLYDNEVYPLSNYAYVVAKTNKAVNDDGFGIIYDSGSISYFPTSHESKYPHENMRKYKILYPEKNIKIPQQDPDVNYSYDVKCYNCFVNVDDTYNYNKYNSDINGDRDCIKNIDILTGIPIVLKDDNIINKIFSDFTDKCIMSKNGNTNEFYLNKQGLTHIDYFEINNNKNYTYTNYDNINVGWKNPEIFITMEDTKNNTENDTEEETQDSELQEPTLFQRIFSFWK